MAYDNRSINNFVQKQGGSLANLGASPTYTGAPANRGTPPGPQNQQPYVQANPNAAFQRPQMPGHMQQMPGQVPGQAQRPPMPGQAPNRMPPGVDPRLGMPQTSLANLGGQIDPRQRMMQAQQRQWQMPGQAPGQMPGQADPRMQQRLEMLRRQRMQNPQMNNLRNLGQRPAMIR